MSKELYISSLILLLLLVALLFFLLEPSPSEEIVQTVRDSKSNGLAITNPICLKAGEILNLADAETILDNDDLDRSTLLGFYCGDSYEDNFCYGPEPAFELRPFEIEALSDICFILEIMCTKPDETGGPPVWDCSLAIIKE